MKNLAYSAICLALFAVFLYLRIPVWFLFLALAIYFGFLAIAKRGRAKAVKLEDQPEGVLGRYAVDGDPADLSHGLYVALQGHRVFVDIKDDQLLEQRRKKAIEIYEKRATLEQSLAAFLERHPEFRNRQIASIGLHSKDLQRAEVFWDPEGYTLLQGLEFSDPNQK
jgi:hypothetical protein